MTVKHFIAASLTAVLFALFTTTAQAGTIVYDFQALCDDCAGEGELFPWNPENMDDEIYQSVGGRLTLFDYTPGTVMDTDGELGTPTEFEFSYFGSTLVDPFSISSGENVRIIGGFNEDASIISLGFFRHIVIIWGAASFLQIDGLTGDWFLDVDGCCGSPNDVGTGAQFSLASVPAPAGLALLGFGLLGFGARRALTQP